MRLIAQVQFTEDQLLFLSDIFPTGYRAAQFCNIQPGDLFGTGTISGPTEAGWGSLSELSRDGAQANPLPSGETRTFLENGDEAIFRARASRDGYVSIGFGECRGKVI